jgi:hypothetical protein
MHKHIPALHAAAAADAAAAAAHLGRLHSQPLATVIQPLQPTNLRHHSSSTTTKQYENQCLVPEAHLQRAHAHNMQLVRAAQMTPVV